jgi:hypothetical protein
MQNAATRSPGENAEPSLARTTVPGDLAARDERERRLDLVLAAGLQDLGEAHARGVDLDDDARARGEQVGGLGLRDVGEAQGAPRAGEVDDLEGAHGGQPSP